MGNESDVPVFGGLVKADNGRVGCGRGPPRRPAGSAVVMRVLLQSMDAHVLMVPSLRAIMTSSFHPSNVNAKQRTRPLVQPGKMAHEAGPPAMAFQARDLVFTPLLPHRLLSAFPFQVPGSHYFFVRCGSIWIKRAIILYCIWSSLFFASFLYTYCATGEDQVPCNNARTVPSLRR